MNVDRLTRALLNLIMLTSCTLGVAYGAERFSIKDIGEISTGVSVEGMNNAGQIVGAMPATISTNRAWWYNGSKVVDFNSCGGVGCRALDINGTGQIVGNIGRNPYVYSHGKFIDLAAYARQGVAAAINDLSEVVGWYTLIPAPGENFPPERHAFLYRGRKLTDLGTLGGIESGATSVNNAGQVVGYATTYNGESHAFLFEHDRMRDLGTLGGTASRANSINEAGHVVGSANVAGTNKPHAFLYIDRAAARFSAQSHVKLKQTTLNPRNPDNAPDNYEQAVLQRMLVQPSQSVTINQVTDEGTLRVLTPIYYTKDCLTCHGSPAGQMDISGHRKEGAEEGDLAGAISVSVPLEERAAVER